MPGSATDRPATHGVDPSNGQGPVGLRADLRGAALARHPGGCHDHQDAAATPRPGPGAVCCAATFATTAGSGRTAAWRWPFPAAGTEFTAGQTLEQPRPATRAAAMGPVAIRFVGFPCAHRPSAVERVSDIQVRALAAPNWHDQAEVRQGRCMGTQPAGGTSPRSRPAGAAPTWIARPWPRARACPRRRPRGVRKCVHARLSAREEPWPPPSSVPRTD